MRIVVVGGGIAGLAAARRLAGRGADVILVEQSGRLGGKLRTERLAGGQVEAGAEQFRVRDPDGTASAAVELAHAVGLGDALVHPAVGRAALAINGELRPIPSGTFLGVPGDLAALDGVAAPAADRDRDGGRPLLGPHEDVAVGALVRDRLGDQVVDRLVDPMLGGVYAGRADDLSLATTMPALAEQCRRERTLTAAVRAAARPSSGAPLFATLTGGMGSLVDAVARGLRVSLGQPVRSLVPVRRGWRLEVGSTRDPQTLDADGVILAIPAAPAGRLLPAVAAMVDYASVALVSLALPAVTMPDLSGFLVPATEGYAVKAATFVDRKWPHLRRPGVTLLRASLGRYGEEQVLQRDDAALVSQVRDELGRLLGLGGLPEPVAARVHRWGGALPQYAPGHLDRVAAARAAVPPTLALAGAAYDGVGIPACIRSGWIAADRVLQGCEA